MIGKKAKIIITVVVPILLVIGGGSFYWLNQEYRDAHIHIKEGYLRFNYTIDVNATNMNTIAGEINNTTNVTTTINNGEGFLTFKVEFGAYGALTHSLMFMIYIFANASLDPKLYSNSFIFSSNKFIFSARELDNLPTTYDFQSAFSEAHNATVWNGNEDVLGAWTPHKAYVGFTPQSNNFNVSGAIVWYLYGYTSPHTYTLRLKALWDMGSIEVPAVIDIAITT